MNQNSKKALAEKIKNRLNSPEYVAMPDLITSGDYHGDMVNFVFGWGVHGNVHSEKKNNWICDMNKKKGGRMIYEHEFEPQDWEEVVNLIEKRNKEKKIWESKRKNIEQKLNQQSNLYYYWGKGELRKKERADGWHEDKDMRGFTMFLGGNGNGLTHHLYIAENHPVLDSFSFQTGFYLVENDKSIEKNVGHYKGGFGCSGGETNPNNWQKYIEASDQITITPQEVSNQPIEKPSQREENNSPQPTKKILEKTEPEITKWLIQYFTENNIQKIELKNGELVITNNNNEIKDQKTISNNPELQNIQNLLWKNQIESLSHQDLNTFSQNSPSHSPKKDYIPYLAGGAIGIGLAMIVVISYYLGKKGSKKNLK